MLEYSAWAAASDLAGVGWCKMAAKRSLARMLSPHDNKRQRYDDAHPYGYARGWTKPCGQKKNGTL